MITKVFNRNHGGLNRVWKTEHKSRELLGTPNGTPKALQGYLANSGMVLHTSTVPHGVPGIS